MENNINIVDEFYNNLQGKELLPPHYNLALATIFGAGIGGYAHKYYDFPVDVVTLFVRDQQHFTVFISFELIKNLAKCSFNNFFKEDKKQLKLVKIFKQKGNEDLEEYYSLYSKVIDEKIISSDLKKQVFTFIERTRELNAISWFSLYLDKEFCWELIKKYDVQIDQKRFDEIWLQISAAYSLSLDKRRELDILSMIIGGQSLDEITKQKGFYFQNYNGYTSLNEVVNLLQQQYGNLSLEQAQRKYDEIKKYENLLKEQSVKILNTLQSQEEKDLFEYIQMIISVRDERKDFISAALSLQYAFYSRNLEEESLLDFMLPFDFDNDRNFIATNETIKSRTNGVGLLALSDGTIKLGNITNASTVIQELKQRFYSNQINASENEIKGAIGCTGFYKGKVRIILDSKKGELQQGEVLVTGMTRPDYVPLMKKAGAIITDEGGITCHAAIVSRELGIPCIIGTKSATQILKDGDLVEVDANKGIIKIING